MGEEALKTSIFRKGLGIDDKTVKCWLKFLVVVWKMTLGELRMGDWMIRMRSADDLQFVLALMLGVRGEGGHAGQEGTAGLA